MSMEDTLADRKMTHGKFDDYANTAQALKEEMLAHSDKQLHRIPHEALDMIMGKIARIITGDQNHTDHWTDIAGYATLVEKHLKGDL